jgi:hypothetical protein
MLWLGKELACGSGKLQRGDARREVKGDKRRGTQYKLVIRADFFK